MAYLIEHASKQENVPVRGAPNTFNAGDHPAKQADETNIEIARNLKQHKQALASHLACFPATAVWLLRKYQQEESIDNQDDDATGLKSDVANNLNAIKTHYLTLVDHFDQKAIAGSAKLELATSLQNFPFNFEEMTQLVDLMAYTFKRRGLSYQPKKTGHTDAVVKRLEGLARPSRLRRAEINRFFEDIDDGHTDFQTLFLSAKEMTRLFPRMVEAEHAWLMTRQKLAQANNKLVLFIANQYKACFLDFEDLVQEGQTGLLKAVDRFDHELGFQFSTYAGYWIRQAISRSLSRCERVVRIPCGQVATINKVYRTKEELTNKTGQEPTAQQLAEHTGLSVDEINTILSISQATVSLENSTEEESSFSPIDFLEQQVFNHPIKGIADNDLEQLLRTAITSLSPREIKVVCSHFGLAGEREMTLQEIGSELNLTRERIRQIQVAALNKIKTHFGDDLLCFL